MNHVDLVFDSHGRVSKNEYNGLQIALPQEAGMTLVCAQVQSAHVPLSRPLVNEKTSLLVLYDYMRVRYDLHISPGDYQSSPGHICEEMNRSLDTVTGQKISFSYDPMGNKVRAMSNKQFALGWDDSSALARLLGFSPIYKDATVDFTCGNFVASAEHPIHLEGGRYVKLIVPQISLAALCIVKSGSTHCPVVPVCVADGDSVLSSDQLTVTFLDEDNDTYDFHGQDHVVVLRLLFREP